MRCCLARVFRVGGHFFLVAKEFFVLLLIRGDSTSFHFSVRFGCWRSRLLDTVLLIYSFFRYTFFYCRMPFTKDEGKYPGFEVPFRWRLDQ